MCPSRYVENDGWQSFELLLGLTGEQAARVVQLGEVVSVSGGERFIRLGGNADRLYLIRTGTVALTMPMSLRGEEKEILLEEKGNGSTLGWSALVPPHRFTLSARAVVDSELLVLKGDDLRALFAEAPDIGLILTGTMSAMIGRRLGLEVLGEDA